MVEYGPQPQRTPEIVEREKVFPLRIMQYGEGSRLTTPYELTQDRMSLQLVDPTTAQVTLVDEVDFQRDLLISHGEERTIITMTGYVFDGDVEVVAWKDRGGHSDTDRQERVRRERVRQVEMEHVEGMEEAQERHAERVNEIDLEELSLKEAEDIFDAIIYTIPRY